MTTAFELNNVSFYYSANSPVLNHLTLSIEQGTFVAIVGPNGAGKSTLLKLCVGLLKPRSGSIRILGSSFREFKNWSKIGYIPQHAFRDKNFPITVKEAVAMGRVAPFGVGRSLKSCDYLLIDQALDTVGMLEYRDRMISELSGGQLQRAVIARTLAGQPELLVMDEAMAGVDARAKESIYSLLRTMHQSLGLTILMVSHDVEQVLGYVDKVANINQGLHYYGDPDGFSRAYYTARTQGELLDIYGGSLTHD